MLTTILVDDEYNSLRQLKLLITQYAPHLEIVASCSDTTEAVSAINLLEPDVVFLDVEMPGSNGFHVLEELVHRSFFLVFCTAHRHYAVKALRSDAFDYLLKPVNIEEFKQTTANILRHSHVKVKDIAAVLNAWNSPLSGECRVALPVGNKIDYVEEDLIAFIEADSKYSTVHFTDGRSQTVFKSLKEFEDGLCDPRRPFMRVHHSFIVNMNHVCRYIKANGDVVVGPGQIEPVSKNRRGAVLNSLHIPQFD